MIMGADKSRDLQSANWKPRKANSLIPIWVWKPENQESQRDELQPESWQASGEELMFQFESQGRKRADVSVQRPSSRKSSLTQGRVSRFVLIRPSPDWMRPTHIRENNLLYSVYWVTCEFQLKTLSEIQNNVWPNIWASCGSIKLTNKVNHHNDENASSMGKPNFCLYYSLQYSQGLF